MLQGEYYAGGVETMPVEDLRKMQFRKLRHVITNAYNTCHFYRKQFRKAGMTPTDIRSFEEFQRKVPIFDKATLRNEMAKSGDALGGIVVPEFSSVSNITLTSGTTGPNTFIGFSTDSLDEFVSRHFMREFWMEKMRPGMKVLISLGGWHFYGQATNCMLTKFGALPICPWGTQFPKFAENYVFAMRHFKPDYVITVTRMLYAILKECERQGLDLKRTFESVKYIAVGADPITTSSRRKLVDQLGLDDLFENGGSSDGLWGGGECFAHKGHHVWMDTNCLEVVDIKTGEPIEEGRGIAINTNLGLGRSVYIRYSSGDLVQLYAGKCDCGRTHTRVEMLDRKTNTVQVNGLPLTPFDVTECFEELRETAEANFCIIRSEFNMERLRLLASHNSEKQQDDAIREKLRKKIFGKLGVDAEIEWRSLEGLPFSGQKMKRVIDLDEIEPQTQEKDGRLVSGFPKHRNIALRR